MDEKLTDPNFRSKIQKLNEICQVPQLFLTNYFSELKRDVDIQFVAKNQPNNTELWRQIINKIESFEKECMKNISLDKEALTKSFNQIESIIERSQPNLENINELIRNVETNIIKCLLRNKTIVFIDAFKQDEKEEQQQQEQEEKMSVTEDKSENKKPIDKRLVIINDEFIHPEQIKER